MFDSKRKKCKTCIQKNIKKSLAQKSLIKSNQRRELHKQRIRKPELDAIVISSMAKKRLSACVFLPPHAFRRMRFCGHTKFLLFLFRCAHRKKNNRHLVCPQKRVQRKTGGREKGKQKEAQFLQCLCSRTRQAIVFFLVSALNFYDYVLRYL